VVSDVLLSDWTRHDYSADPARWLTDRLGEEAWSAQRSILSALTDHRYVAVPSGHDLGKSFVSSRLACLWLDMHPVGEAFVVTTAPSAAQVSAILWREITRARSRARDRGRPLMGRVTRAGYPQWHIGEELVAFGRKPGDTDPAAFQGIHARYLLVILDEAGGIPAALWDAARALVTSKHARMLAIGNPDDPVSEFERVCRPNSGWHVVRLDGLRSPGMNARELAEFPLVAELLAAEGVEPSTEAVSEDVADGLVSARWVAEMVQQWCGITPDLLDTLDRAELHQVLRDRARSSQTFTVKVRGEFAGNSLYSVIPLGWAQRAMERWRDWQLSGRTRDEIRGRDVFGVDVARGGSDECAIAVRRGDLVERIVTYRSDDTMGTVEQVLKLAVGTVGGIAMVDSIGIGAGVLDRLRQMRREGTSPLDAQAFTASAQSGLTDITGSYSFRNDRSAAWWRMHELLDPSRASTVMLPDDDRLLAELSTPRWTIANGSVIIVESKDELRKRLGRSTDRADAVISAFFTSSTPAGSVRLAVPADPVMSLLRHDPSAAWEVWNAERIDTTGTIWHDPDPYVTDAGYYGYVNWGHLPQQQ
jgi:hypothetical protein